MVSAKILLVFVIIQLATARKCSYQKDSKGEAKSVDCGAKCDFCRYVQITDTLSDKAIDSQGCGCGKEHQPEGADKLGECVSEFLAEGTRKAGGKTPIKIHIECCKKESCKK